jgi:hypothetical protein
MVCMFQVSAPPLDLQLSLCFAISRVKSAGLRFCRTVALSGFLRNICRAQLSYYLLWIQLPRRNDIEPSGRDRQRTGNGECFSPQVDHWGIYIK